MGDPVFAEVGPKNGLEGLEIFFQNFWIPVKVFNIIEFPNIFHWKPAKKSEWG